MRLQKTAVCVVYSSAPSVLHHDISLAQPTIASLTDELVTPTSEADSVWKRLTTLYVLALSTVALLAIIGQVLVHVVLEQQHDDAHVINIAGRQRMLSQKLVKAGLALSHSENATDRQRYSAELQDALIMWQQSGDGLRYGDPSLDLPGTNSTLVAQGYADIEPAYQAMQQAARTLLTEPDEAAHEAALATLLAHESVFLAGMDSIVFQYAAEAEARVSRIRSIEYALLFITLLVLLLEGLYVFRPTARRIRKALTSVTQANTALKTTNKKLDEARVEAIEAARAKSAFLATMSHEIRTPMNGVIGMTSLLRESRLDEEQREYTRIIRSSGEILLNLINDILDFSKIEAGKITLEEHPFDLYTCVEDAVDLLAEQAFKKEIELVCDIEEDVPRWVIGDSTRVRQVLVNLLSNAVKFTHQGSVVVTVRSLAPNGLVGVSVKDTGIGIPKEHQEKLFQPFVQADSSTTRRFAGTGLGLSICKRLTELMGGEITLTSEPSVGSTFEFSFQIILDDRPQTEPPKSELLIGRTVLIVDDNESNRIVLERMTRRLGMQPTVLASVGEVLEAEPSEFDVAVLDMNLPSMTGLTMTGLALTRVLKEKVPQLPVIILSSIGEYTKDEMLFASLTKPVKKDALRHVLIRVFEREALAQQNNAPPSAPDNEAETDRKLRILLAEDNVVNQKVARLMLRRLGYEADISSNGLEAIEAVRLRPYDLILMDVQMPELDGLEATKQIRAMESLNHQPWIVALTANAMQGDRERCLEAGMDGYLSKPLRKEDLALLLDAPKASLTQR